MPNPKASAVSRRRRHPAARGFSLIELLIVISLLAIIAGVVVTSFEPTIHDQLTSAAQIVAGDLNYARNLAVTGASTYRLTFDVDADRYLLEHTGANASLHTLPASAYRQASDLPTQQTTDLTALPLGGGRVELVAVQILTPSAVNVGDLEFGPLGETTRSEETVIWLAAGAGDGRRYCAVRVDPVTGLAAIGGLQVTPPTSDPSSPTPSEPATPIDEPAGPTEESKTL